MNFRILLRILFCVVFALSFAHAAKNTTIAKRTKNTPFDLYTLEGEEKGATLLVIGGIHGDEPGGFFAPALLTNHYKIKKGNLLVVPNLNPDSIIAFRRGIYTDMNRKFAVIAPNDPDFDNVERIKRIIKDPKVDFVINLHDGHGFYREKWENSIFNPKAWGQTYVIDQQTLDKVPFGNLDEIAKQIVTKLNQTLHYDYHTFGVRNTETKYKDEVQQNSLTYFAITNLKPALAIETSKNITELPLKTLYQLSSIETLMGILGITFQRDFELNLKNIEKEINHYGFVNINHNITLDLNDTKKILNFVPLLKTNNQFDFSHALGRAKRVKNGYALYVGHKQVALLKEDIFPMQCKLESIKVVLDGKERDSAFGEFLDFEQDFLIQKQKDMRVNVIGYSKKGVVSEDGIKLRKSDISKNYALNQKGNVFRVEIYEGKNFCGMLNLRATK